MKALEIVSNDSSFSRSLSSNFRITRQANQVVQGKKLLDADPEALLKAAKAEDLTKVWRILAAYTS